MKEITNLCFKEDIADSLVSSFTCWGRKEERRSLYTQFIKAIYGKVF